MIDQHCHTILSPDAAKNATLENYIAVAEKKGVKAITFTDHLDYDALDPLFYLIPDFYSFKRVLDKTQETTSIKLYMGVELGYQKQVLEAMKSVVNAHDFNVVLLSVHYINRQDPYSGRFYQGKTLTEAYQEYFETALEAIIAFDGFQILAHLDYIFRYSPEPSDDVDITVFYPVLDTIFEALIKRQKVLELNTSPYRKSYQNKRPNEAILRRYYEKGGRLISLGSDAHNPDDLAADFDRARTLLKSIGFTALATFEHGVMKSQPL
jgi:histidinol-phosphatase (PHP family)